MLATKTDITKIKLEPYEPCPCDSGVKFKFCCLKKARDNKREILIDPTFSDGRIDHMIKQFWENTDFKTCLAFNQEKCSDDIKNAHSIQNNKILNRISKDSHVYKFGVNVTQKEAGSSLELTSKNKASTFFGFCGTHDTEIFRPIEVKEYVGDSHQNFLFAFRAHSIEHHRRIRKLANIKNIFKQCPYMMLEPEVVYTYRVSQYDVRDLEQDYKFFKQSYFDSNFDVVRTIHRQLDYEVNFATCTSFSIEDDLEGKTINEIYSIGHEEMPSIYLNVFPVEGKTNIIISYLSKDEQKYGDYFEQLDKMTEERLIKYLNYLIIQYTENVFFNPTFIDNMSDLQKESLLKSFDSSIYPLEMLHLVNDGKYFNFNLFKKDTD
ncbi:hypothetical protein PAALTS15_05833 [Paenibacillus alvei TS-15]|uniref:SecC motif-containing protein n=1 Tax=Paenibacillus alvei TS-15 TaxID=1117108 RepID=S9SR67_PAEAL|nr:SEC-C domain-containing protein [Paenibacillus alvei]EPY08222.1 hypothetical protein PAALTS15_05833 [Paenibacillus alvei TS-15]